jgi:L-fucose mutarotase/ribose pyranase (RbsD/FucU family)
MSEIPVNSQKDWEARLGELLPFYGHRNWIVIADSAYPAQARAGIEILIADASQMEVLRSVLAAIEASGHVRANVYLDEELSYVTDRQVSGVSAYRQKLEMLLNLSRPRLMAHERIIARLDEAAQVFRVLIIKTQMVIPYSSVFLELDCGYWDDTAEKELRQAMSGCA